MCDGNVVVSFEPIRVPQKRDRPDARRQLWIGDIGGVAPDPELVEFPSLDKAAPVSSPHLPSGNGHGL
jgi:hypothetical protein